ncbi:MAG: 50S ribosome-binding GTPase [Peptococcaceae bacterium]|nr:50S ribosome-binding GTPase [Peptococcaceae bacterium]
MIKISSACKACNRCRHFRVNAGPGEYVIALMGNPNTGKSTVFNALTGLRQHTGNWPGKTVLRAEGIYYFHHRKYILIDLPGTYSLMATSVDEQTARDFLCLGQPDATIVVIDATCLERNLNLVLQVLEITPRIVVAVNLIDEAERKRIRIDCRKLSKELGVPVVPIVAREGRGIDNLKKATEDLVTSRISTSPRRVRYDEDIEETLSTLEIKLKDILPSHFNPRWVALRLIEGDPFIYNTLAFCLAGNNNSNNGEVKNSAHRDHSK